MKYTVEPVIYILVLKMNGILSVKTGNTSVLTGHWMLLLRSVIGLSVMVDGISDGLTVPAVNVGWYDASDNIMVVNFEFFMCVEFMVDLAVGGLVVGDGSDNMTEKRLCKFSLTGFQCLVFYRLIKEGKRIILVGDNKFKVVDNND